MLSTKMGLDVIQLLIRMEKSSKDKTAVLQLLKTLNSTASIDILKSLRDQVIIYKAYLTQLDKEKDSLVSQLDNKSTTILKRSNNKNRMIDYGYSIYKYFGHYDLFQINEYENDNLSEMRQVLDFTKTPEEAESIYKEIKSRIEQIKEIKPKIEVNKEENATVTDLKIIIELNDGQKIHSGVTATSIKSKRSSAENGFVLNYTTPEGMPVNDNLREIFKADLDNLCPIIKINALGFKGEDFGFYNTVSLSDVESKFVSNILKLLDRNRELLDDLEGILTGTINEPATEMMYLGRNLNSLNQGSEATLMNTYRKQMERLKDVSTDQMKSLVSLISNDCKSLILTDKISKLSFEIDDGANGTSKQHYGYDVYCKSIDISKNITEEDREYYGINLSDYNSDQCQFIRYLANKKILYSNCKCDLPKSLITLLKLFNIINYGDNLAYYNEFFKLDLTADQWEVMTNKLFQEVSICFKGVNAKESLKQFTTITNSITKEIYSEVEISKPVTKMAILLNRAVTSYSFIREFKR